MTKTENETWTIFDKRTGKIVMTGHFNNYNEPSYHKPSYYEPTAAIRDKEIIIKILNQAYADKMVDKDKYSSLLQLIKEENNHSVAVIRRDDLGLLLTIYTIKEKSTSGR